MKILVVDDEKRIREILSLLLEKNNYEVETAKNGEEALLLSQNKRFDIFLLDINLPGISGLELFDELLKSNPDSQFVFLTAHATVQLAVETIKKGAYNFLQKPFDNQELLGILLGAVKIKALKDKVKILESQLYNDKPFSSIIGNSTKLQSVLRLAEKVAPSDARILVTGESGTGKELLVRELHKLSKRANNIFIPVNCAAIPYNLFESEFFGHKKGAFTGAIANQMGKFREADGGTLFLDEVGELPMDFQPKLLRAIESGEIIPVGHSVPLSVNVRIIAATNKDLSVEVKEGRFREDLYYRLKVFQLHLPSLKERDDDIDVLSLYFSKLHGKSLTEKAMNLIRNHKWRGNIRELSNEIHRASILADDQIKPDDLSFYDQSESIQIKSIPGNFDLNKKIEEIKVSYCVSAMNQTNNNKTMAADLLGITYRTFNYIWDKVKQQNID